MNNLSNKGYEVLVKDLVLNTNFFSQDGTDAILLETTKNSIQIEFKNKNLIIKEFSNPSEEFESLWKRILFQIFKTFSEK